MALSVVIGGSTGIGLVIAQRPSARGDDVVVTSRDAATAEAVAQGLGPSGRGLELELGEVAIESGVSVLLGNAGVNAHDLVVDGGVLVT